MATPPSKPLRLTYGTEDPLQFGELYLPTTPGPHPVVVFIHGGYWRAKYGLDLMHDGAVDLSRRGYAVWNIEYRRVGNPGGGWPGTFLDVALATDHVRKLAPVYNLDLQRVVPIGHSAGGHFAFWLAGRPRLPPNSPVDVLKVGAETGIPLPLTGAISLAGVVDLKMACELKLGDGAVIELLGGTFTEFPDRYALASPAALLPLGVPQVLTHGTADDLVPIQVSVTYANAAKALNDPVTYLELDGGDHFVVINPQTQAWAVMLFALEKLMIKK